MRAAALAAVAGVTIIIAGCGPSEREVALDLEQRVVDAVGVEPTSREYLEREGNAVNDVADTVKLVWVGIELGDDPGGTIAEDLRAAGLDVARTPSAPTSGDPRGGSWTDDIGACDPEVDRAGVIGTIGTAASGELVLLLEVGGPPATAGCIGQSSGD